LVLDLRSNGGGYLDILCEIAAYFCKDTGEKNPVVAISVDKNGKEETFSASKNLYNEYFQADSRICVLADSSSASASECLIGAMLDYKAIAYGDICLSKRSGVVKTYGKGIMQASYYYPMDKSTVTFTVAYYNPPYGGNYHGDGVQPDVTVEIENNTDTQYEAALKELQNLIKDN
jgi:carboxyl-terminal processing protease